MATTYTVIPNVTVNKLTKSEYDSLVTAGIITADQIENQVWIFSDDNFLSAANLAKLNQLDLSAMGEANVIDGVKVNGAALTPDGDKVVNVVVPTALSDLSDDVFAAWAKAATKPAYTYSEISGTPTLAAVATSGSYTDLSDTPTIPAASQTRIWTTTE